MENGRLGKTISFLRKQKGYTQRELSVLLDISFKMGKGIELSRYLSVGQTLYSARY